MALIRWQPFREVEMLRLQFDDLFDELAGSNRENELAWMPAVELQDSDSNLILRAQIPGIEAKDLDIQVTREAVSIAGEHRYEKKAEDKGLFRSEFRYGKFQRTIPLPVQIQNDKVQANFKDGVLTLTLPKVEEAQRRVVRINLGESNQQSLSGGNGSTQTVELNREQANNHSETAS